MIGTRCIRIGTMVVICLAASGELVPGVGAPNAGDDLPDRFGDQLRLILMNVVTALGGNEEAGVRHERRLRLVRREQERLDLLGGEPLRKLRIRRKGERHRVGKHRQRHRAERRGRRQPAHLGVACRIGNRLGIAIAGNRE